MYVCECVFCKKKFALANCQCCRLSCTVTLAAFMPHERNGCPDCCICAFHATGAAMVALPT